MRFGSFDGLASTIVAYTTDIPAFADAWGQPYLLGPGSIHVAHTLEERVAKRELIDSRRNLRKDGQAASRCFVKHERNSRQPNAAILNAERPRLKRGAHTRKNLAIVGYGKMGRLIEQLAPEYGFAVQLRLDSASNSAASAITPENFRDVDVAVEFSNADAAAPNIERLAALGVNTVVGTTGWTATPRIKPNPP